MDERRINLVQLNSTTIYLRISILPESAHCVTRMNKLQNGSDMHSYIRHRTGHLNRDLPFIVSILSDTVCRVLSTTCFTTSFRKRFGVVLLLVVLSWTRFD